jgi:hypothetical protein
VYPGWEDHTAEIDDKIISGSIEKALERAQPLVKEKIVQSVKNGSLVIHALPFNIETESSDPERMEALHSFPAMEQDSVLDSRFFPLLFEGDKEMEGLIKQVPTVNPWELYEK